VRDARFVGLSADGRSLIVEHDGEHLRLPVDDDVRAAVRGQPQMRMPLEARVSPRELQLRIRRGESAADIAAESGVAVEMIARFEGPVLDERRWHAERASLTVVDGTSLSERFASATSRPGDEPEEAAWDSWLADDGTWRVRAELSDGRGAVWTWDPRTRRLRGRDDLARLALSGDIAANDLEAVLRPIAAAREAKRVAAVSVVPPLGEAPPPGDAVDDEVVAQDAFDEDTLAGDAVDEEPGDPAETEEPPRPVAVERAERTRSAGGKRRAQVPSWDDIVFGASRQQSRTDDA
jgi:hypothetical protein